jgi:hypothetical protein
MVVTRRIIVVISIKRNKQKEEEKEEGTHIPWSSSPAFGSGEFVRVSMTVA